MHVTQPQKRMPDISVVMPVYNVAAYIPDAIRSIVSQSFKEFELLLIDDCSQDNSMAIATEMLKDTQVNWRVIHHTKNKGLSAARNTGILEAQGKFIVFVDSDDWMDEHALGHFFAEISCNEHSIVCGNTTSVTDGVYARYWTGVDERTVFNKADAIARMLDYKGLLDTAWAKIYPRSLFLDNKIFFPLNTYFEDTPTNIRLANAAKNVIALPYTVYYYRRNRAGSILQLNDHKSATDRLDAFANIYAYLIDHTEVDRRFADEYYLEVLVNEYRNIFGRYKLSWKEQFLLVGKIHHAIGAMRRDTGRKNFKKEIGVKFNWILSNRSNRHPALFFLLHNKRYSVLHRLINLYLKPQST